MQRGGLPSVRWGTMPGDQELADNQAVLVIITCPWQACLVCRILLCFLLWHLVLCARHPVGLLVSVACYVCISVHPTVHTCDSADTCLCSHLCSISHLMHSAVSRAVWICRPSLYGHMHFIEPLVQISQCSSQLAA